MYFAKTLTLIGILTVAAAGQTLTLNRNWLPAAIGAEPVRVTFSSLPPEHYQLLASGQIGVRWNGTILPTTMLAGNAIALEFVVPAALRTPGFTEFVLWDTADNRALPYRDWVSVVFPSPATLFEADIAAGRLVAATAADGTAEGPGGAIGIYSIATGALLGTTPVPPGARVLAFTPDTLYAWIAEDEAAGKLARLRLADGDLDSRIQISGGTPPYKLRADVWRIDPQVLVVRTATAFGESEVNIGLRVFANGSEFPGIPNISGPLPLNSDDKGRVLLESGIVCDLTAAAGFTNCRKLVPGSSDTPVAAWNNKAMSAFRVADIDTGATLLQFDIAGYDGKYLPETNRALVSRGVQTFAMDGESLEQWATTPFFTGGSRRWRVQAPDWLLAGTRNGIAIGHVPQLAARPVVFPAGVVNSASLRAGAVAPGEIVSLFGQNLGPEAGAGPLPEVSLRLASRVEETQVYFDGVAAPILYTGAGQINTVVPESVRGKPQVTMQVTRYGIPSARLELMVADSAPALFGYQVTGKTYAAALNDSGQVQSPAAPLRRGRLAVLYATGVGLAPGEKANGIAARAADLPVHPAVSFGGRPAQVVYAGNSPTLTTGLTQINTIVPPDAPTGDAVAVTLGGGQTVLVAIQ